MEGTSLNSEGLKKLIPLKNLRCLSLPPTITDRSLEHLVGLQNLTMLTVRYTGLTNLGLKRLTALKNLEYLSLPPTVTDEGLLYLSALPNLRQITLHTPPVTDDGLKHLLPLRSLLRLRIMRLGDTEGEITEKGVAEFKASAPNRTVYFN